MILFLIHGTINALGSLVQTKTVNCSHFTKSSKILNGTTVSIVMVKVTIIVHLLYFIKKVTNKKQLSEKC